MNRLITFVAAAAVSIGAAAQLPQPPEVAAKSYILVDLASSQVLAERDADAPSDPASLTKLMTAYLVFQALRDKKITLEQTLPVSLRAWAERKEGGSLMFIEPRDRPKVDDLLKGMIVNSGNDAAVALAEGVGGTLDNFVALMNRQAQAWGLKTTAFKNVTGLTEPGHQSSARDVSVIASKIITDFPEFYPLYSMRKYRFQGAPASNENNRNVLLARDPTVDGMKTGYTQAAGYCLVASAVREFPNLGPGGTGPGKRRLLSVLLNTTSMEARATESQRMLNWGYTAWDAVRLFDPDKPVATPALWKGRDKTVRLGVAAPLVVSLPHGEAAQLRTQIERPDPLIAPLAKAQRVGTLKVSSASGAALAAVPLVALDDAPEAGWFGRAWDALRLWIQ